jgi:nicotinamide mononucleotide transporter
LTNCPTLIGSYFLTLNQRFRCDRNGFNVRIAYMEWMLENGIELTGAFLGLVFVYLEIKAHVMVWPIGILSSVLYTIVFYRSGFFGEAALQIYFILASFYGWWKWVQPQLKSADQNIITTFPREKLRYLFLLSILLFGLLIFALGRWTSSPVPFQDAFLTTLNIIGTWMLAKKYIEHWWVWIVVNFLSTLIFYSRSLYPTVLLYFIFFVLSFVGLLKWKPTSVLK